VLLCGAGSFAGDVRAAGVAGAPGVRVVRADAEGVLVEVAAPVPTVVSVADGETSWSVEGWSWTREAGAPELPVTGFNLAVPPGTRPVLSVRVPASLPWPGDPPQPAPARAIIEGADGLPVQREVRRVDPGKFAEPYPAAWAALGTEGTLRFLRVVPVTVSPYRWDPSLRAVLVASRLEVEVRFEPDPAADAGGLFPRRAHERIPGRDDPGWERLYDHAVLNAESARAWRRAPALRTGAPGPKSLITAPEFRIPVTKSDLYRVPQASLVAVGWDSRAVPVARVAVFERFFDERSLASPDSVDRAFREQPVSIQVRDLDGDGQFGPGDDFIFFGLSAWDRLHPQPRDKRYGREHDYFVTVRDEGGARFAEGTSLLAPPRNDLVPVSTSVVTRRYEGDGVYMTSYAAGDETGDIRLGVSGILNEHMYWVGGSDGDYPADFDLPGILAGRGNLLRLSVPVQRTNLSFPDSATLASFSVRARSSSTFADLPGALSLEGKDRRVYELGRDDLAAFTLASAGNTLRMRLSRGSAALDWMEWTWRRNLIAVDRRLFFQTNEMAGPQEFRLLGFSSADTTAGSRLVLLDLADSARTAVTPGPRLLAWRAAQVDSIAPGSVALRVQLDLGDPPRPRTIYAVSPAAAIVPSGIEPVSRVDPTEPDGPDEELVIITHPDFLDPGISPGVEALAQARRAQGLSVRVLTTRQIYDRFNGGRPGPVAIRNYLRYLYRARVTPPSFLLLVGDASDDFTGGTILSAPNFVPTQTVFSDSRAEQGGELVSSDEWFVDNLTGLGERIDFLPDMHIGRIPAGSSAELKAVVEKILNYGVFHDTDSWRSRSLLISDDEFSTTLSDTQVYSYRGDIRQAVRRDNESIFRWAARETRRIIQEEAGFAEFGVDTFFTATYMDTVPGLQRCREVADAPCTYYPCPYGDGAPNHCLNNSKAGAPYADDIFNNWREDNYDYGKTVLPPILRQYLNRGNLLAIYQGHANGHLMSHEYIYQDAPGIREDTPLLQNDGRPFFFMGFGCHLAEFSRADEGNSARGDCICEKMLFAERGRGAVAALASTAYEWMGNTHYPNLAIARSMFVDPPHDPVTGHSRWLLGEIVTDAKWRMEFDAPYMSATYTLLGDPSMPLEMVPPPLSIFVNCDPHAGPPCEPWTEGTALEAEAQSDTVRIRVLLRDAQSLSGRVTLRDSTGIIDPSAYRLVPDPDHPGDDRRLELAYNPVLAPPANDYDIEIELKDAAGLVPARRALLPVQLTAEFFAIRDGVPTSIGERDLLEPGDSVLVRFASPVGVDAEVTELWLDDAPLPTGGRPLPPGLRRGELRAELPNLSEQRHRLRFRTSAPGGDIVERVAFFRGPGAGEILLLYNFPNPFGEGTDFCYQLNRTCASAKVTVFTLSGRRIWSWEGSAPAERNPESHNAISWDGRDADGDAVANGLYLYKLEVRTTDGRTLSRVERAARIR
jgi:hypothetical protein